MRIGMIKVLVGFMLCNLQAQPNYDHLKARVEHFKTIVGKGKNIANTDLLNAAKALNDSIFTLKYYELQGDVLMTIGRINQQLGRMGHAEIYFKEGIQHGRLYRDSLWVASALARLGGFYGLEERSFLALELHLQALMLREVHDTTRKSIADSYHNIAGAYIQINELSTAENYLNKALELKNELKDTFQLGIINTLFADVYSARGQYEKAEAYYFKDIPKRLSQNNYEGLTISFLGLADNYKSWGKNNEAEIYYLKALQAAETIKRQRNIGLILLKLGELYRSIGQADRAKAVFKRAIDNCTQVDSRSYQLNAYRNLYLMYKEDGNLPKAMEYLELLSVVQDTTAKEALEMKMEDMQAAFELSERENKITALDNENKKGKQLRNILILSICLLLSSLAFVVFVYRGRNKALHQLTQEQAHTKALLEEKEALLGNLQQTNLQLIHAEKMASIGVMTAGIAHELNNPVSAIHASVEALMMDFEDLQPLFDSLGKLEKEGTDLHTIKNQIQTLDLNSLTTELQSLMATINNGAQRTAQIVQGLKTFARDSGDEYSVYNITEGLETALTILQHKINHRITIKKDYHYDESIVCQTSKINQVLLNILDNAVHAVELGGHINIETKTIKNECVITITDDGSGMDADVQKKIFEPFFTTKEVGKGTGLGLSISYAIVKQHHGDIVVHSQAGKGTSFVITLPIDRTQSGSNV
ncbi:MAG: GHKL domain-containing protein [Saprospiraceae bacterium]|nr:GHKL domain-containing protein [Saprospiraceae bacterium]